MTNEERAIEWLYPGETLNPAQIRRDHQIAALAGRFAKCEAETRRTALDAARMLRGALIRDRVFGNAPEAAVQQVLEATMWVDAQNEGGP